MLVVLGHRYDQEVRDLVSMTAFLLSWLSSLKCPVINRPTPTCLSGPYWRQEHWVSKAAMLGIPVRPLHRRAALSEESEQHQLETQIVSVTVVGERCFGKTDDTLVMYARQLADLAGVDLITVHFSAPERGGCFIDAHLGPDLTAAGVADAILAHLQGLA